MRISEEFLQSEIVSLEQEKQKAEVFAIQAQATIHAYKMLLGKLDEPEPEPESEPMLQAVEQESEG